MPRVAMKAMTLRLEADLAHQLELVARTDRVPVAEAIREAAEAHVKAKRADPAFMARLEALLEADRVAMQL